jgi:hypothetical protein
VPGHPIQHEIEGQAISAVRAIWAKQGASVEEVHRDYGEDLAVQTCLNGRVDESRVWVQVKGQMHVSGMDNGAGKAVVRVPYDRVRRWALMPEPVILVLWDVSAERGWYTFPGNYYDINHFGTGDLSLPVYGKDVFNVDTANEVAWHTRISRFTINVHRLNAAKKEAELMGDGERIHYIDQAIFAVVSGLMVTLGILLIRGDTEREYAMAPRFRDLVISVFEHGALDPADYETEYHYCVAVIALVIFGFAHDLPGCHLPSTLLSPMVDFSGAMLALYLTSRRGPELDA